MSELQFRAYDYFNGEFFYSNDTNVARFFLSVARRLRSGNKVSVMRWTGARDKELTQLYEGDRVLDERGNKAVIEYADDLAMFELVYRDESNDIIHGSRGLYASINKDVMNIEIIGTVYDGLIRNEDQAKEGIILNEFFSGDTEPVKEDGERLYLKKVLEQNVEAIKNVISRGAIGRLKLKATNEFDIVKSWLRGFKK